jgi:hypothetical protein
VASLKLLLRKTPEEASFGTRIEPSARDAEALTIQTGSSVNLSTNVVKSKEYPSLKLQTHLGQIERYPYPRHEGI